MKVESYTHQVTEFLRGKEIGHVFTSRSLHEDIITTPGQRHIPNADLVSASLTRHRRVGAISGVAKANSTGGNYYEFTLVDPSKLKARFATARNGRHDTCKAPRDLKTVPEPDLLEQVESMRGEEGGGHYTAPKEPEDTSETMDTMAEVKFHIRQAFKAYKRRLLHPLPEIAVKSIPTDILAEELTRRVKGMARTAKESG